MKRLRSATPRTPGRIAASVTVGLAAFLAVVALCVEPDRTYRATYRVSDLGGGSAENGVTSQLLRDLLRRNLKSRPWLEKTRQTAIRKVGTEITSDEVATAFGRIKLVEGHRADAPGITLSLSGSDANTVKGLLQAVADQLATDAEAETQSQAQEALSRSKSQVRMAKADLESAQLAIQSFMRRFRSSSLSVPERSDEPELEGAAGDPATDSGMLGDATVAASPTETQLAETDDRMWAKFEEHQRSYRQAALRVEETSEAERKAWIATFEAPYYAVEAREFEELSSATSTRLPWTTSLMAGILAVLAGGGTAIAGESGASVIRSLDQARAALSIPIVGVISMVAFSETKDSIPRARQWTSLVVGLAEWFLVFCVLIVAGNATVDADFRATLLSNPLDAFQEAMARFGSWIGLG